MTTIHVNRLTDDNEFETIGTVEDGEIIEGTDELTAIADKPTWTETPAARLESMFSGPRIMVGVEENGDGDTDPEE